VGRRLRGRLLLVSGALGGVVGRRLRGRLLLVSGALGGVVDVVTAAEDDVGAAAGDERQVERCGDHQQYGEQ
jgi:hypothetical protein